MTYAASLRCIECTNDMKRSSPVQFWGCGRSKRPLWKPNFASWCLIRTSTRPVQRFSAPHYRSLGHRMYVCLRVLSDISRRRRKELRKELTDTCNSDRLDGRRVEVQWSSTLDKNSFPFLHDRFAILDGALWHFGSTVGGGHPGLTAVSGPWPAIETRAVAFFDECWRVCNA